ncbi:MAG TPA: nitroreductase family protein [Jatrophihabitantaceae bacterium]|nr:nitroreductase family protein [Jatrophihabitantaceae bacterium]
MQFADVVRARHMTRTYQPDEPVPRETIDALLRLALRAPSAGNTQGWRFLVLDSVAAVTRFWDATVDPDAAIDSWLVRLQTAPALVVVLASERLYRERYAEPDKGSVPPDEQEWPVPYWYIDAGMAAMTILLGAADDGLGACLFGVPTPAWSGLRAAFAIPPDFDPVAVISLGRPAPDRKSPSLRRGRRPWDEVVAYGSFD